MDLTLTLAVVGAIYVSYLLMKFVLWLDGER